YQHLQNPVPRIGGILRTSRFGIEKVIARCLQKKPADRFQTYAELRSELRRCAESGGIALLPFAPTAREMLPLVGDEEIRRKRFTDTIVGSKGYAIVRGDELEPYIKEADLLVGVGEWKKAYDILYRLYVPEMISQIPDSKEQQSIAVTLGLCLSQLNRQSEA